MTVYTVHAPPPRKRSSGPDASRYVFVKEGFCWPGLLIPLLWLIFRRMWIVLAFYLIAVALTGWLGRDEGFVPLGWPIAVPLSWALGLFVPLLLGFEGNDLRRWSLGLRGYELVGVVVADSHQDADIRYFARPGAAPAEMPPPPAPASPAPPAHRQPLLPTPGVVGLFPTAGSAS